MSEYIEWDDGVGRWKHPNQSCGVKGSPHDVYDRALHAATQKQEAEQERLRHACVASGRYDTHVWHQGLIRSWEVERAERKAAWEQYKATGPADEIGKMSATIERGLADSQAAIDHEKQTYADICNPETGGCSSRSSNIGGVPIATSPLAIAVAAFIAIMSVFLISIVKNGSDGGSSHSSYGRME